MGRKTFLLLGVVVLLVVCLLGAVLYFSMRNKSGATGQTQPPGPLTSPGALSDDLAKPRPIAMNFHGCPPSGDGGDPALNTLKNRVDEGQWQPTTVQAILDISWPPAIERQPRARWSKADSEAIARREGSPVQVEGYLVDAKKMSPESCNCHSVDYVDFHIWLVDSPDKGREQSIVIEASPRVRSVHPAWSLANMRQLAIRHEKVRISGWLMMDPEHPDQVGKTRGTIWEIHPIMQIETQARGGWKPLDNGTTGVSSAPAAAATLPAVTPQATATVPPVANAEVQDNTSVQITGVFADGKGVTEPDEYVEITNKGTEPVDITDWLLQDASGRHFYKWESYTLQPDASIRVYTNETHPESGGFSFGSTRPIWGNSGDTAELYDVDKELVSRYTYGKNK